MMDVYTGENWVAGKPTGITFSDAIMQYFKYDHLPPELQDVSKPFCVLADYVDTLPDCEEKSVALRKLLEAKDAAIRAAVGNSRGAVESSALEK